jgi:hypothetical protein
MPPNNYEGQILETIVNLVLTNQGCSNNHYSQCFIIRKGNSVTQTI